MTDIVDFETAKLLKERGFRLLPKFESSYPTIAEVVMWLHKEKGLWVNVMYMGFELKYSWSIDIITTSGSDWDSYGEEGDICYKSPTEAYEAAIIYTLKNLI